MIRKIFIIAMFSLIFCTSASAIESNEKKFVEVQMFELAGDTPYFLNELCTEYIIERLVNSNRFKIRYSDNGEISSDSDYIVKGTLEVKPASKNSIVRVIINFEFVNAKTNELVWGRRVWEDYSVSNEKFFMIKISNGIYRTADKVVSRLITDMDSGKLFLK